MNDSNIPTDEAILDAVQHHDLLELFDKLSFREKVHKFFYGLGQPHDSGDYKWAKLQLVRMLAPASAVMIPLLLIMFLMACATVEKENPQEFVIRIERDEPTQKPELDKMPEFQKEAIETTQKIEVDFVVMEPILSDALPALTQNPTTSLPVLNNSSILSKPMTSICGLLNGRSPAARIKSLQVNGSSSTEDAVMRALRWLKKNQREDGSWGKNKQSMTGLGLLTFLAHGETPASEEFGPTVEKAIKYLVDHRDSKGGWNRRYEHAICTYAMCEAYALTKVPMLKDVCETAVEIIIQGQNPTGGWCYSFNPPEDDDTSVMGWCAQALKAAKMAGIKNSELDNAMKLSVIGFQKNAVPTGGFGYRGPSSPTGLSGVGVLCMQLLGAAGKVECKSGLDYLDSWTYSWEKPQGGSPIYYWYYITQAKFHEGGERWNKWNNVFWKELLKNQQIEKDGIVDDKGVMRDIGHWVSPGKNEHNGGNGAVMDTCLSTLQLQVYYRYLPTYKKYASSTDSELDDLSEDNDLDIEINI